MVAIKGAQYVPPSHEKVPYMIDEVFDYATKIMNGFELAIFLHYFYVGVHPHADGNGRISRFLINLALVRDKYNWLTIPSDAVLKTHIKKYSRWCWGAATSGKAFY